MKTFRIKATMRTYLLTEIEAENEEEAWKIANDLDGGLFEEVPHRGDWDITDIIELEEEA